MADEGTVASPALLPSILTPKAGSAGDVMAAATERGDGGGGGGGGKALEPEECPIDR